MEEVGKNNEAHERSYGHQTGPPLCTLRHYFPSDETESSQPKETSRTTTRRKTPLPWPVGHPLITQRLKSKKMFPLFCRSSRRQCNIQTHQTLGRKTGRTSRGCIQRQLTHQEDSLLVMSYTGLIRGAASTHYGTGTGDRCKTNMLFNAREVCGYTMYSLLRE